MAALPGSKGECIWPMRAQPSALALTTLILLFTGCESARLPVEAGMGPNPALPAPVKSLIPTVLVATARGWPDDQKPAAPPGVTVTKFAAGLDHPRWLYVLPNGDVLVAETNSPPKEPGKGIKAWFIRHFMKRAGAAVPSANRITLLRDADGDGVAETQNAFLTNLFSPFGMTLVGNDLYVANADAVVRFRYSDGATSIAGSGTKVADLPGGPLNHHWTKSLIASPDGKRLYVGVGSNSNVAERGMDVEVNRAAILEIDPATGRSRVFASGLRNPVGIAWNPGTGVLWTVVNERDELGSDLVPDYLTSVRSGGFYGWPYSYYGQHVDSRVKDQRSDLVASAIVPDFALGSHTGSLGLAFSSRGAYVGQHGSWNRRPRSGYKVIFIPFANGRPSGAAQDLLTGFVNDDGEAYGRPVGVVFDRRGGLLVADDVGNVVWRVANP
jgi:glucose/arabinose dehydrogenase